MLDLELLVLIAVCHLLADSLPGPGLPQLVFQQFHLIVLRLDVVLNLQHLQLELLILIL